MKKIHSSKQKQIVLSVLASLIGIAVGNVHAQDVSEEITYNSHVANIINQNCVVCHREGGVGPMQLTTYDQVRPWAPVIQYRVKRREMPPYAYDHNVGIQELEGDWRLSQEDIDTIVAWVDQGSPMGNPDIAPIPADIPSLDEWSFTSILGEPDIVVTSDPIDIPASGNDMWHRPYNELGTTENRCIKAVQVKPRGLNSKGTVHHANSTVQVMNEETGQYEDFAMLSEYAMGKWGELMPDGVCRTLPAGGRVAWSIHMFPGGLGTLAPGGVVEDAAVELGIWFYEDGYEETAKYEQTLRNYFLGTQEELAIPPNGYEMTQGFHSFDHPVRIDSFQPHGHLRMRAASLEIYYPDQGLTESVGQVSNWSATWHHNHIFKEDAAPLVPAGAVIVLKQWYDNTASNPNNPDPDQWVMGGSRTADEMTHMWLAITHLDDEGYQELLEERAAKQKMEVSAVK